MGSTKRLLEEYEELLPMYDWIEENYGGVNEEDHPTEWAEAVEAYDEHIEHERQKQAYYDACEMYDYYMHQTLGEAESRYQRKLVEFEVYLGVETTVNPDLFYKMCFAHLVTIFETTMEDMAKTLIVEGGVLMGYIKGFCKKGKAKSYTLNDLLFEKEKLDKAVDRQELERIAFQELSGVIFHKLTDVANIFEAAIGHTLNLREVEKPLQKIMTIRHDIVHRDGFTLNGKEHQFDKQMVQKAIHDIKAYIEHLRIGLARPQMNFNKGN